MTIIRPDSKPRLWWLVPWAYARTLHRAANALRALTDRQEEAIRLQAHIIVDQSEEIANLRRRVEDLNDAIIKGIIPAPADVPPEDLPCPSPRWTADALRKAGWPWPVAVPAKPKAERLDGADLSSHE